VFATANQRELLSPGILDVHGNVPTVLAHPPERHHRPVSVASPPQGYHERRRQDELHQRTTQQGECPATEGEEEMSGLVNRQIETVQPPIVAR
jgi:hypothetical protein